MSNSKSELYQGYDKFSGNRKELVSFVCKREKEDPTLLLRSKSTGKGIPCSLRRIDTLTLSGIFPEELESKISKGPGRPEIHYKSEHLYRYELHIRLRKMGLKIEDIAQRLSELDEDAIQRQVKNWNDNDARGQLASEKDIEKFLNSQFKELKRLGRAEGKVLMSEQLRFAVTPYFHAYVTKREFEQLSEQDVDVLVAALGYRIKKELGFK